MSKIIITCAEMITSTLLGGLFFAVLPDGWTFVGVAVLIACAVYISMRERARASA